MPTDPSKILLTLFACSILLLGRANRQTITEYGFGDDDDYWSYGRSLVYDGDFDFSNEPLPTFQQRPGWKNYHSPVPGLFWTPAVAMGRMLGARLGLQGEQGASQRHRLLVSAFSSSLVYLGLLFLFSFLRHFLEPSSALLATILSLWSTPLMFFTWRRPLMAHSVEFLLLSASALTLWHYVGKPTRRLAFGVGVLLMLASMVRYTNVFMAIGLLMGCLWQRGISRHVFIKQLGWVALGALIPLGIQLGVWQSVYGQLLPPTSEQYSFSAHNFQHFLGLSAFTGTGIRQIFFGGDWGLLWMEPVCWLAILGVFIPSANTTKLRISLGLALLPLLVIAANFGSQGGSYGYRYLLVKVLWVALCSGLFLQRLSKPWRVGVAVSSCAVSILFLTLYASGPDDLTLQLLPARDGVQDWINNSYVWNAIHYMLQAPQQIVMGLSGAPILHTMAALMVPLNLLSWLPASVMSKLLIRVQEVPMGDLWWYVGWQLFFVWLFYYAFRRFVRPLVDLQKP